MNTTTNSPTARRIRMTGAAAGATFALALAAPAAGIPDDPDYKETAAGTSASTQHQPGTRPCFLYRAHWNDALDGPQPRC